MVDGAPFTGTRQALTGDLILETLFFRWVYSNKSFALP